MERPLRLEDLRAAFVAAFREGLSSTHLEVVLHLADGGWLAADEPFSRAGTGREVFEAVVDGLLPPQEEGSGKARRAALLSCLSWCQRPIEDPYSLDGMSIPAAKDVWDAAAKAMAAEGWAWLMTLSGPDSPAMAAQDELCGRKVAFESE